MLNKGSSLLQALKMRGLNNFNVSAFSSLHFAKIRDAEHSEPYLLIQVRGYVGKTLIMLLQMFEII